LRHGLTHEGLVVRDRRIRRITFAPSADHHEKAFAFAQIGGFRIGHIGDATFEPGLVRRFGDDSSELLGIAGFGPVKNGERHARGNWRQSRDGSGTSLSDASKVA